MRSLASPQGPLLRDGGYAQRLGAIIAEGGLLDQIGRILADERGPIGLANTLADLTSPDHPLGRALERDGLLDRLANEDGPFIRLLESGGPLDHQLADDGALERFIAVPSATGSSATARSGPLTWVPGRYHRPGDRCFSSCLPARHRGARVHHS